MMLHLQMSVINIQKKATKRGRAVVKFCNVNKKYLIIYNIKQNQSFAGVRLYLKTTQSFLITNGANDDLCRAVGESSWAKSHACHMGLLSEWRICLLGGMFSTTDATLCSECSIAYEDLATVGVCLFSCNYCNARQHNK